MSTLVHRSVVGLRDLLLHAVPKHAEAWCLLQRALVRILGGRRQAKRRRPQPFWEGTPLQPKDHEDFRGEGGSRGFVRLGRRRGEVCLKQLSHLPRKEELRPLPEPLQWRAPQWTKGSARRKVSRTDSTPRGPRDRGYPDHCLAEEGGHVLQRRVPRRAQGPQGNPRRQMEVNGQLQPSDSQSGTRRQGCVMDTQLRNAQLRS